MAARVIDIVKQGGKRRTERFDQDKLRASVVAACLSVRSPHGEAETAASTVCNVVLAWLEDKPEVTSGDIRRVAAAHLHRLHPEAAYLYKHHRLVL
jgi:transcriptional regulator NrdR family protein